MSLFHLVENSDQLIQQIYNTLLENGLLISSATCIKGMAFYIRSVLPIIYKLRIAPKVLVLSNNELINMMKNAGFKIDHQWQPQKKCNFYSRQKVIQNYRSLSLFFQVKMRTLYYT